MTKTSIALVVILALVLATGARFGAWDEQATEEAWVSAYVECNER